MHLHDPFLDVAAPFIFVKYAKFVPLSRFAEEEEEAGGSFGTTETKAKSLPKHRRTQSETNDAAGGGTH